MLSQATRDIDYHGCFDDLDLVPFFEKMRRIMGRKKSPEEPALVQVLLDRWQFAEEIKLSYARGKRGRDVHPKYVPLAANQLPEITSYFELRKLLLNDVSYQYTNCSGMLGRAAGIAWSSAKVANVSFESAIEDGVRIVGLPEEERSILLRTAAEFLAE